MPSANCMVLCKFNLNYKLSMHAIVVTSVDGEQNTCSFYIIDTIVNLTIHTLYIEPPNNLICAP